MFNRKEYVRPPVSLPKPIRQTAKTVISEAVTASPKENAIVSEAYRKVVRGLACMRCNWPPRSQFCHSDEGKGMSLKTDDRRGWAGCAICHYLVGTSGTFPKAERRALDAEYSAKTRAEVLRLNLWPKNLPKWEE